MIPKPYYVFAMQIGDFGILVRSGFSVSKALFFNFLSALVALAGTALVCVNPSVGMNQDSAVLITFN